MLTDAYDHRAKSYDGMPGETRGKCDDPRFGDAGGLRNGFDPQALCPHLREASKQLLRQRLCKTRLVSDHENHHVRERQDFDEGHQ
jgi:hypothetical protein